MDVGLDCGMQGSYLSTCRKSLGNYRDQGNFLSKHALCKGKDF